MSRLKKNLKFLFDAEGESQGVWMSAELWNKLDEVISPELDKIFPEEAKEPEQLPEPLKDWEALKTTWDLSYPIDGTVHCDHCGSSTEDWEQDEPRKFRLKAANFGGLVRFECQSCHALVSKKHFKDKVVFECTPPKNA